MKFLIVLFSIVSTISHAAELAVVSGSPDSSLDFVQRLVSSKVSIPNEEPYESMMATLLIPALNGRVEGNRAIHSKNREIFLNDK